MTLIIYLYKQSLKENLTNYKNYIKSKVHELSLISDYHISLFICGGKHLHFLWIALQPQRVFGEFLHVNTMKAHK